MPPIPVLIGLLTVLTVSIATPTRPNILTKQHLKITHGNDTDITHHPWQVSVQMDDLSWCSGFLISPQWVLTSAYCLFIYTEEEIPSIQIRAGSTYVHEGGQLINAQEGIIHPDFYRFFFVNDIALIRLAANVTDPAAKVVRLPEAGQEVPEDTVVSVAGWGIADMNGDGVLVKNLLQEIEVPVINRTMCKNAYTSPYEVMDYMFCAGGNLETGNKDACIDDEGSPATIGDLAVGIVSWRLLCGEAGLPGIYTQISDFRDWIRENSGI